MLSVMYIVEWSDRPSTYLAVWEVQPVNCCQRHHGGVQYVRQKTRRSLGCWS